MTAQQLLTEAFQYDLWANRRWLEFLPQATPEEQAIFAHILKAQAIWADRINGQNPTAFADIEPSLQTLEQLHKTWITHVQTKNPDQIINYTRLNGDPQSATFSHIARHVANHGTYHRGHMRGLCQARNCLAFPETDFILFDPNL